MAFMGGGLGRPGQRVSGHQDKWSEYDAPIKQTLVRSLIAPIVVILTFLNVFLVQSQGIVLLVYGIALFAEFVVLVGGTIPVSLPIFGKHNIRVGGTRTWWGILLAVVPLAVFWWAWSNWGQEWVSYLWYKFWPIFQVWKWEICVPCARPPLWLVLLVIPSTIGTYQALGLLGFRFGYEITDPNWPPTNTEKPWDAGPYHPDFVERSYAELETPQEEGTWMAQTVERNNGGRWVFYEPPKGVTQPQVWTVCHKISMNEQPDGKFVWPGAGSDGVSDRKHRTLQGDWIDKGFAVKNDNNTVELTEGGIEVMKKVLSEAPRK